MKSMITRLSQYGVISALVFILGASLVATNLDEMSALSQSWLAQPERIAPARS